MDFMAQTISHRNAMKRTKKETLKVSVAY